MAGNRFFNVTLDVAPIEALAAKLAGLTAEQIGALMVDAINTTADGAYDLARKTILSGINLTDSYIQDRMKVAYATAQNPTAAITAVTGKRSDLTLLSHYGAMQLTQAAKHPSRSKGDTKRGIAPGQKTAGVSVEVVSGNRKTLLTSKAFIAPNLLDSEDNPFVFKRIGGKTKSGKSKLKLLKGPSVYQLFSVAAGKIEEQVYGDLSAAVIDLAERQFEKELS